MLYRGTAPAEADSASAAVSSTAASNSDCGIGEGGGALISETTGKPKRLAIVGLRVFSGVKLSVAASSV